jgi:predicted ABC-class ATPase
VGIPQGITLILGDEYSGRAELMRALAHGIYNHVPGDGRELVVTGPDAVYVAAESGRSVQRVDISAFLPELPDGGDPTCFSTADADACTAQAAATVEAIEIGARVLMYDETDSSPAFLSRDSRLSGLLPEAGERIQPLSARARQMVDELGVSLVVAGSSFVAEFIPLADKILRIDRYRLTDITEEAQSAGVDLALGDADEGALARVAEKTRWIVPSSVDPSAGIQDAHIAAPAIDLLEFGRCTIDLNDVRQLAEVSQTETIGHILSYAKRNYMDEGRPIRELLDLVDRDLGSEGLECLNRELNGKLARPRRYEVAAALNRLETLRINSAGE